MGSGGEAKGLEVSTAHCFIACVVYNQSINNIWPMMIRKQKLIEPFPIRWRRKKRLSQFYAVKGQNVHKRKFMISCLGLPHEFLVSSSLVCLSPTFVHQSGSPSWKSFYLHKKKNKQMIRIKFFKKSRGFYGLKQKWRRAFTRREAVRSIQPRHGCLSPVRRR